MTAIFKPTRVVTIFFSKIEIVDLLFLLLNYLHYFAENALFSNYTSYKQTFRCEKSRSPVKLCKLKKNRIFSHNFLREKARQSGNITRYCIQGLATFYIPFFFVSILLLKEVTCQKRLFFNRFKYIPRFLRLNASRFLVSVRKSDFSFGTFECSKDKLTSAKTSNFTPPNSELKIERNFL